MAGAFWQNDYWHGQGAGAGPTTPVPGVLVSGVSAVSICNLGLVRVGADPIASLDDNNEQARVAKRFYASRRDALLRLHTWNFAQVRVSLVQLSEGPAWGYAYAYALPTEPYCLDVVETDLSPQAEVRIEGRMLVTDEPAVGILYIGRVPEYLYDALFVEAFADDLASLFAYPLTRNATLEQTKVTVAKESLKAAKSRDGQEGRHLKTVTSDRLTRIR
jgi:hypothetical protein